MRINRMYSHSIFMHYILPLGFKHVCTLTCKRITSRCTLFHAHSTFCYNTMICCSTMRNGQLPPTISHTAPIVNVFGDPAIKLHRKQRREYYLVVTAHRLPVLRMGVEMLMLCIYIVDQCSFRKQQMGVTLNNFISAYSVAGAWARFFFLCEQILTITFHKGKNSHHWKLYSGR